MFFGWGDIVIVRRNVLNSISSLSWRIKMEILLFTGIALGLLKYFHLIRKEAKYNQFVSRIS